MISTLPEGEARPRASTSLARRLTDSRSLSLTLAAPLTAEDMCVQAMDDASPTKWHLAHTTWFYETFLLLPHLPGYRAFDPAFGFCFNSYYETLGNRQPRAHRGVLTRPSVPRVLAYRAHVDEALGRLLAAAAGETRIEALVEIGIHHEQQHQELLLSDILALFASNPLRPAYQAAADRGPFEQPDALNWISYPGGIRAIGHASDGFAWDNETPRHEVLLHPYRLADRLVTNAEWLAFIEDGGYREPLLWLADGWARIRQEGWDAPLYWENRDGAWMTMTLGGLVPLEPAAPVCHINYYEADAYARWCNCRLPTEAEWEVAAALGALPPSQSGPRALRPVSAEPTCSAATAPRQMFGHVWQWTQSAYLPYPGYRPAPGALGEYNGKFMVSQHVLRGSSCATPEGHARATYRNFFYPHQRWQFTGLRLASEAP